MKMKGYILMALATVATMVGIASFMMKNADTEPEQPTDYEMSAEAYLVRESADMPVYRA